MLLKSDPYNFIQSGEEAKMASIARYKHTDAPTLDAPDKLAFFSALFLSELSGNKINYWLHHY